MEKNQKINCTVCSCKYNDENCDCCTLQNILVAPVENNDSKTPYECMCSSYKSDC